MAEALVVLGTAANVLQLIEVTCKTISRIQEFKDARGDLPKTLELATNHVFRLRILLIKLKARKDVMKLPEIKSLVQDFNATTEELRARLERVTPMETDPIWRKAHKAFRSITTDREIQELTTMLHLLHSELTNHLILEQCNLTTVSRNPWKKGELLFHRTLSTLSALFKLRRKDKLLYDSLVPSLPLPPEQPCPAIGLAAGMQSNTPPYDIAYQVFSDMVRYKLAEVVLLLRNKEHV